MHEYAGLTGGSITVKAETAEDDDVEDDDEVSPSDLIVLDRAISVRFGHIRDRASASSLSVPLTKCTVKSSSCIAMNHRVTIEVGFCFIEVKFIWSV